VSPALRRWRWADVRFCATALSRWAKMLEITVTMAIVIIQVIELVWMSMVPEGVGTHAMIVLKKPQQLVFYNA